MAEKDKTLSTDEMLDIYNELTAEEEDIEGLEEKYQRAEKLMKCISCMNASDDKIDMYQKLAKRFKKLSGYKDSEVYAKKCKKLAKKTSEAITEAIYNEALRKKSIAKSADNYKAAQEDFQKIGGYQNADEMALECNRMYNRIQRTSSRNKILQIALAVFCLIAVFLLAASPYTKYQCANALKATGHYSRAINIYKEIGNYKDSKDKIQDCHYLWGISLAKEGRYKSALGAFADVGYYKDSQERKAEMEKLLIRNSDVGKIVKIGKTFWIILSKEDHRALMIKKLALPAKAYNEDLTNVTWENSSLRGWLNSEYLEETFSDPERNQIMLSDVINEDNTIYGTEGGNDTKDYLFLLSMKEAAEYSENLPKVKSNCWLRSPGSNQSSAAFLSIGGVVMGYGYEITSEEIKVYPAMWFNLD